MVVSGSALGLLRLNPYTQALLEEIPSLLCSRVLSVASDIANKLWIGTSESLTWFMPKI